MYTTIRPACSLFYDLLLPLSLLLLLGVSPAESQSIAALHPSSVPASALRITVFGSGFNVSRDYSCGIAGAGGVTAACPRAIPRSSTMIECTYVPAARCRHFFYHSPDGSCAAWTGAGGAATLLVSDSSRDLIPPLSLIILPSWTSIMPSSARASGGALIAVSGNVSVTL